MITSYGNGADLRLIIGKMRHFYIYGSTMKSLPLLRDQSFYSPPRGYGCRLLFAEMIIKITLKDDIVVSSHITTFCIKQFTDIGPICMANALYN